MEISLWKKLIGAKFEIISQSKGGIYNLVPKFGNLKMQSFDMLMDENLASVQF